jgi:GDP-L-fucose synthase
MEPNSKIYVAGHRGLVGRALVRELTKQGYHNLIFSQRDKVDLTNETVVKWFFSVYQPEYVFLCAAKVGGIKANANDPLGFFLDNMAIERNVIMNAADYGVKKLLFLGSSCIYPRDCPQPIKEEYLMTGPIDKLTEPYALAKIAGIRLCQWLRQVRGKNFVTAMPCNLFGRNDNFDETTAHVIPGLIARLHRAAKAGQTDFKVWGSPNTMREFLYADDLARALILIMLRYHDSEPINTGSGIEFPMSVIANRIAVMVGYDGDFSYDHSQPIGVPRKLMDDTKLHALGWRPEVEFAEALRLTFEDFLRTIAA